MFTINQLTSRSTRLLAELLALAFVFAAVSCSDNTEVKPVTPTDPGTPVPTAVVTDLQITETNPDRVILTWQLPETMRPQERLEIRRYDESITADNWIQADRWLDITPEADSGQTQSVLVTGLTAAQLNYLAIRVRNEYGAFGPVSDNITATMPSLLAPPIRHTVSGTHLTVSDFNRDGRADLAVSSGTGSVKLYSGDGNAGFSLNQTIALEGGPTFVRAADFNGDGYDDLAVAATSTVEILTNDGTGQFEVDTAVSFGTYGTVLRTADLDNDGYADIITGYSSYSGKFGSRTGQLAVSFSDGSGRFPSRDTVQSGIILSDLCPFDADGDGDIDLAVFSQSSRVMNIYVNDGTGGNWSQTKVTFDYPCRDVVVGDIDYDGDLDLGVALYVGKVGAAINNGQGEFTPILSTPGFGNGNYAGMADFNRDGFLDLVRADNGVTMFLNDGKANFAGAVRYPSNTEYSSRAMEIADFNNDGHLDILELETNQTLVIFLSQI